MTSNLNDVNILIFSTTFVLKCNIPCYISVKKPLRRILIVEGCQMDMKILDQRMIHCPLHQRNQSRNIGELMLDRNNRLLEVQLKVVLIAQQLKGAIILKGLLSLQHLFFSEVLFWFLVMEEHSIVLVISLSYINIQLPFFLMAGMQLLTNMEVIREEPQILVVHYHCQLVPLQTVTQLLYGLQEVQFHRHVRFCSGIVVVQ